MTPAQHYDAVVIGSGQGGSPLASVLAGSGRKTWRRPRSRCASPRSSLRRARAAQLAVNLYELGRVGSARKHLYGLLVC